MELQKKKEKEKEIIKMGSSTARKEQYGSTYLPDAEKNAGRTAVQILADVDTATLRSSQGLPH